MNFQPLQDRILVERLEDEKVSKGGIIIPDTAKEKPMEGLVVEVGEGTKNDNGNIIPLIVKQGDKILFAKWGGTEVKLNGKEYLIMKESDVLGIFKN
jgi:chaperonin GroES